MIDQSHCIEPKIPAMIRSALNVQTTYAKALLVNRSTLRPRRPPTMSWLPKPASGKH